MADEIGEDGAFAILTSTFSAPVQARWIAEMAAYAAKCHPEMTWLGDGRGAGGRPARGAAGGAPDATPWRGAEGRDHAHQFRHAGGRSRR